MTIIILMLIKRLNKEKFLYFSNIYINIKLIVNILISGLIIKLITNDKQVFGVSNLVVFFIIYTIISTVDCYLIFRKIKKIRSLDIKDKEYIFTLIRGFFIMFTVFLVLSILKYCIKDVGDILFICVMCASIWAYSFLIPYIIKITNKVQKINISNLKELYVNKTKRRIKTYTYEGVNKKSANAFVTGTFINRHVFISDYFIENATEEEISSILLHEYAHIKNFDLEKRNIFINIDMTIFLALSYGMDYFAQTYMYINIFIGLVFIGLYIIISFILFTKFTKKQELRADRYAVSIIGDKKIFINALNKLYILNDAWCKENKLFSLFSTHPNKNVRINEILEIK